MNAQDLQEIFKEQIDTGLSVAPFLVTTRIIANNGLIQEDEIFNPNGRTIDSLSDEEKSSIHIVRLYADLSNFEELASDALYDTEFVKMNNNEPVFVKSINAVDIQDLSIIFKDSLDQGLTSVPYMIERGYYTNDLDERRVDVMMKEANLSDLSNLEKDLVGLRFKRIITTPTYGINVFCRLQYRHIL